MGIGIYTSADASAKLSLNGDQTNPLGMTFDGRKGGTKEFLLYVRNDDSLYFFNQISLTVNDSGVLNLVNRPEDGWSWKISYGDTQPTAQDWANIEPINTIGFADLGSAGSPDTATYLPFWLQVQTPPGEDANAFNTIQFLLSADRNTI